MQRLGLCCLFIKEPIRFRTTTVKYASTLSKKDRITHFSNLIDQNLNSLLKAIAYCSEKKIGSFRINSRLLPLYTHNPLGYDLSDLPHAQEREKAFAQIKRCAQEKNIRLSFHPDQFVILNSPNKKVVTASIAELEYHALISQKLGADVINIHGGGGYGDKRAALDRFAIHFRDLSSEVSSRLTLENDDRTFTPTDLLPLCEKIGIPFVYDIHHHRCLKDLLSEKEATSLALTTWKREPLFHISSPKEGWKGGNPKPHHDFINPQDVPEEWSTIDPLTLDVEAKAKECAVLRLQNDLKNRGWHFLNGVVF